MIFFHLGPFVIISTTVTAITDTAVVSTSEAIPNAG